MEEDKKKWLARDGQDWSGAFGQDPTDLLKDKRANEVESDDNDDDDDDDSDDTAAGDPDLGITDGSSNTGDNSSSFGTTSTRDSMDSQATGDSTTSKSTKNPIKMYKETA